MDCKPLAAEESTALFCALVVMFWAEAVLGETHSFLSESGEHQ